MKVNAVGKIQPFTDDMIEMIVCVSIYAVYERNPQLEREREKGKERSHVVQTVRMLQLS